MSERPTPRSIGVCALIALRSDPSSPFHEIDLTDDDQDRLTTLLEFSVFSQGASYSSGQTATNSFAFGTVSSKLPHVTSSHPQTKMLTLSYWLTQLCQTAGQEVTDLVMDTLDMASESVDSLLDLMESLRAAIAEGLVDTVSAHGVYLRQTCLGFEELSFESITFLWQELNDELDHSNETMSKEVDNLVAAQPPITTGIDTEDEDNGGQSGMDVFSENPMDESWPLSAEQVNDVLRQYCLENRRGSLFHQSFEAVELRVRATLEKNEDIPSAYFLRFLNCLHHGERVGAFDSLHQFFDHAMVKTSSPKEILQFSAILLAIAHSTFGDQTLALMATEEAVRVAQQSKDAACVAFALGWLFENEGQGTSERRELLKRCAARAAKGQIRSLVAGSSLRLAVDYLQDSERNPELIWTTLIESTAEPTADGLSNLERSTSLTPNPRETMTNLSRQAFVAAGIWDELGMPALSGLTSMSTLKSQQLLSATDVATAIQNIMRLSSYGIDLQGSEPFKLSGEKPVSHFAKSLSTMIEARNVFNLNDSRYDVEFVPLLAALMYERAVNLGDDSVCQTLETILESSLLPYMAEQDTLRARMSLQNCRLFCRQHKWVTARATAEGLLRDSATAGHAARKARALIQLAVVELDSTYTQVHTAFPRLLEALATCEKSKNFGLHAIGLTVLARIFLRLQQPKRARAILKAAIPVLYEKEEIWFRADAYLALAKANIQLAGRTSEWKSKRQYRDAVNELNESQRMFDECEDKEKLREVYYLQARTLTCLGMHEACEEASKLFLLASTPQTKLAKTSSSAKLGALQPLMTSTNRRRTIA